MNSRYRYVEAGGSSRETEKNMLTRGVPHKKRHSLEGLFFLRLFLDHLDHPSSPEINKKCRQQHF
jgi:hypothetical protein